MQLRVLTACAVIVSVFVSMASIKRKVMRNDIKNVFDSMPLIESSLLVINFFSRECLIREACVVIFLSVFDIAS